MIAALILAGGASRRMGEPKALLPFPDQPLVASQWLALRAASCDPLRIVLGPHAKEIEAGSGLAHENFVVNAKHALGQFSSIRKGLQALLEDDTWPAVVVQPVDALPPHPAIVLALAARIAETGALAAIPSHEGKGGHPVMLSRPLAAELAKKDPEKTRLDELLHRLEAAGACERVEVYTGDVLVNLNEPKQYQRALRDYLGRGRGAQRKRAH